ncbi:ParB/RepB/Spo0J family plasmid partition protein (plasmid) [Pantoea sp. RSPAM1]|uniref:ParB/RepB/Spo0J family plasmid partition protein n=1 Tax=Pantoea sp. RSPAM1 TaxID=2675223 RepID=UPI00315CCC44
MKRAPIITKSSSPASPASEAPSQSAAPVVGSLISRVGNMSKGNTIVLPVCGRDVKFVLETISPDDIADATCVWSGNERLQDFLTESALDDLIPSFLTSGQQNPAFGRHQNNSIQIADGSRRRMAAILTSTSYRVLVGDLDDEQMNALSKLGNDYRPTSAYERGKRYAQRLEKEFANNISALADAESISRKIISRCINTSKLPKEVIALFSHPGELSARAGEQLHKLSEGKEELLIYKAKSLSSVKKQGDIIGADDLIKTLMNCLRENPSRAKKIVQKRDFGSGVTASYKDDKVTINLDRRKISAELIQQLEKLLSEFCEKSV